MHAHAALILLAVHTAAGERYSAKYSGTLRTPPPPASTLSDDTAELTTLTLSKLAGDGSKWPQRVVECARQLGVSRCVKAFSVCRSERAVRAGERGIEFDLRDELGRFPWERFAGASDAEMDSLVVDSAAELLQRSDVSLVYPGLILDLTTQRNGSLHVDFKTDALEDITTGRGRGSRWRRTFNRIVPFILIPSLIMAAILPFKLPAFMMMAMGAVILNNMAFMGSLFTLLRNNAFDDNYEKKVIYVNEGYKNEESYPPFPEATFPEEAFSEGNFQTDGVQGDKFFSSDLKVKKRRGHKKKRKPIHPEGPEEDWRGPEEVYPLEGLSGGEGIGDQFGGLYQGVEGGQHGTDQLPDYTDFGNSIKSKLNI